MNIKTSVILYSLMPNLDSDAYVTPIAIYVGNDIYTDSINLLRLAAKHLAQGDFSVIHEKEGLLRPRLGEIKLILAAETAGSFDADGKKFFIQPFVLAYQDKVKRIHFLHRQERFIYYDKNKGLYEDASRIVGHIPNHLIEICDLVNSEAYDSPFIFPSPFVWEGPDLYTIDRLTRKKSGPYRKADWFGTYYLVYSPEKGGIVDIDGKVVADCVFDRVYSQSGYVVLGFDGKWGLYSHWNDLLVAPKFDDIEMPEDDEACLMVRKGRDWGYVDTDGGFHLETDVDINLTYL